jgi:hypothetical protein
VETLNSILISNKSKSKKLSFYHGGRSCILRQQEEKEEGLQIQCQQNRRGHRRKQSSCVRPVLSISCEILYGFLYSPCVFACLYNFFLKSDAPALSTDADAEGGSSSLPVSFAASADGGNDSQWDDAALAAATTRRGTTVATSAGVTTKDWADLKGNDFKSTGDEKEDIATKLRIEETRAQLDAAKEGIKKEAQRLKEEKEKREQEAKEKAANRFGTAAAGLSGGAGGKWVPSRMRAGGTSLSDRFGGAGMGSQKVDMEDENLFPDLASADKILEKQKNEQPAYKAPKKTPVGGGATWGNRPKLNLKPKTQTKQDDAAESEEPKAVSKPAEEQTLKEEAAPPPATVEAQAADAEPAPVASTAAVPAPAPIKPKKKKKKDLSTFGKK